MSLVGPRPLVVEEDQRVEGWHRRRLELMPGMTGPWQILGPARVPLQRDGRDRLPVRGQLVAVDRRQDPAAHRAPRARTPRALEAAAAGPGCSRPGYDRAGQRGRRARGSPDAAGRDHAAALTDRPIHALHRHGALPLPALDRDPGELPAQSTSRSRSRPGPRWRGSTPPTRSHFDRVIEQLGPHAGKLNHLAMEIAAAGRTTRTC